MPISVRKASIEDIDEIMQLWEKQYKYHHHLDPKVYSAWGKNLADASKNHLREGIINHDKIITLVAIDNEKQKIIGYYLAEIKQNTAVDFNDNQYGYIDELFIETDYRRKGVGTLLMKSGEDALRKRGITNFRLNVSYGNSHAISFYKEKLGFHPAKIIMTKSSENNLTPRAKL